MSAQLNWRKRERQGTYAHWQPAFMIKTTRHNNAGRQCPRSRSRSRSRSRYLYSTSQRTTCHPICPVRLQGPFFSWHIFLRCWLHIRTCVPVRGSEMQTGWLFVACASRLYVYPVWNQMIRGDYVHSELLPSASEPRPLLRVKELSKRRSLCTINTEPWVASQNTCTLTPGDGRVTERYALLWNTHETWCRWSLAPTVT